jgi:FdhD protein
MAGPAAPEVPIWVEINGRRRTCWSASPGDIETLVRGYLLSNGYITGSSDIQALELVAEPPGCSGALVTVAELNVSRIAREHRHMREHGCGLLHFVICEPQSLRRARALAPPAGDELVQAFRALFAATDAAFPDGGMHAAALWDGQQLLAPRFDVGRHNAVDRALGAGLPEVAFESCGLLTSARVSGAIAAKAAKAGVAFIASRSIPTSLAVQIADCAGLPIVARAGRREERRS